MVVFLGVDEAEEPPELAVVGARPLQVQQMAGLRDALQEAVLAQLLFHLPGEPYVEKLVLLAPDKHYFL